MHPRIQKIKESANLLGYDYKKIADMSGVPFSTVSKLLGGHTENPSVKNLELLEKALNFRPQIQQPQFSQEELKLINAYRILSKGKQITLLELADDMAKAGKMENISKDNFRKTL